MQLEMFKINLNFKKTREIIEHLKLNWWNELWNNSQNIISKNKFDYGRFIIDFEVELLQVSIVYLAEDLYKSIWFDDFVVHFVENSLASNQITCALHKVLPHKPCTNVPKSVHPVEV